jgi:ferritin
MMVRAIVGSFPSRGVVRGLPVVPEEAPVNQVVVGAICRQINAELTGSYAYLAMSAYCAGQNFHGFAHWLRVQSEEEHLHAMKLLDFLLVRNHAVDLQTIAKPQATFDSVVNVFEVALQQEQQVGTQIDALYELAFKEKAFAALVELQWFITEQVEEEKSARDIVAKMHLIQHDAPSMLDLDRELGSRTLDPGSANAAAQG